MNPNHITPWEVAKDRLKDLRLRGEIIVSTNGCFDLLHPGHVSYLEFAKSQGHFLVVGINSDASVKKLKGPTRPLNNAAARAAVLSGLRSVDMVCEFTEDLPLHWLSEMRPDVYVKGSDYKIENLPETPLVQSWGGKVILAPFVEGFSSSRLIKLIEG